MEKMQFTLEDIPENQRRRAYNFICDKLNMTAVVNLNNDTEAMQVGNHVLLFFPKSGVINLPNHELLLKINGEAIRWVVEPIKE